MSNPFIDLLNQQKAQEQREFETNTSVGPFEGLVGSAVSSIPGLIGIDTRSSSLMRWQAEHPMLTLTGELGASLIPYVGWYKATKLPSIARRLEQVTVGAKAAERPIATGALREVVRWTPFEAGRTALTAAFGDPGAWQDVLGEGVINVALGAGIGGLAAGIGGRATTSAMARREAELKRLYPDYDRDLPRQLQLRQLLNIRENRIAALGKKADTDQHLNILRAHIDRLKQEIGAEQAPKLEGIQAKGGVYLRDLLTAGDRQELNRLFYQKFDSKVANMVRLSPSSVRSIAERETLEKAFQLPENYEALTQFVRFTRFKTNDAAKAMQSTVRRNMHKIGDETYLAAEKEGLYVVAKRLPGEHPMDDRWMMLKTDQPGVFEPGAEKWAESVKTYLQWQPGQVSAKLMREAEKTDIYGNLFKTEQMLPKVAVKGLPKGNVDKAAEWMLRQAGFKGDLATQTGALADLKSILKSKIAPSMFQFRGNSTAAYIFAMAKQTFEHANTRAAEFFHGSIATPKGSVFSAIQKGPAKESGGIQELINRLDADDLKIFQKAVLNGYSSEKAVAEGASPAVKSLMDELARVDKWLVNEINTTAKLTGRKGLQAKDNHFLMSRFWRGDYRVPIYSPNGNLIAMASGYTPKQALKQAQKWIERASKDGIKAHTKPGYETSDFLTDLALANKIKMSDPTSRAFQQYRAGFDPKTFKERKDVGGFAGEFDDDLLTKTELSQQIKKHLDQYLKYVADISVAHRYADDMAKLATQDPQLYQQLAQRLHDLAGRPTWFSKMQNQVVDKIMDAVLPMGKNSATKIVSLSNSYMVNFQLGMGNIMFPVLNAFTFLQTVVPEVAFVMKAMPESLARSYTFLPVYGVNRTGGMGMFDMLKFMKNTFHEMKKPSSEEFREHLKRAIIEGSVDPRFAEEYVGEAAAKIKQAPWTKAGKEAETGWLEWMRAISEFPIGATERFARGHAFTTGHLLGRHIGLADEQLYRFAKDFTNNTMFGYSTSDRARLLTGPMGSLFGLFKNWQMHYFGNMVNYMGEGFQRNNWAPLMWQIAGTMTTAGAGGLPLYGVADTMSRWMSDKSLMLHLYESMDFNDRDNTALEDGIFYGLPGFLGVSLQGSASAPLAEATRDFSMFFSVAMFERAKYLQGAAGDAIDHWITTGQHPFHDPAVVQKFSRALGPKSLYRSLQVIEDDALRSLQTGYPVISGLSLSQRAAYAAGFTPTDIERAYRVNEELWQDMNSRRDATTRFGEQLYQASRAGDGELMNRILMRATVEGLDVSSVIRSWKARAQKEASENVFDRTFDPGKALPYRQAGMI